MTYFDACNAVLRESNNGYAKAYALAGSKMTGEEARVQALYILNNITHWRGGPSKEVRAFLKEFSKKKGE